MPRLCPSNPSFSLAPWVWPEWVSWTAWQTALLALLACGFLKWCWSCFSGCTVQFGSYVRFPACGRRDLGGTLAGRRLLPLVAGLCRRRSGVPRGQARRPLPVFKTGMRAATRLCRPKNQLSPQRLWLCKVSQRRDCALASACYESYRHFTERNLVAYPVGLAGSSDESFLSVPELPQRLRGPGRVYSRHWTATFRSSSPQRHFSVPELQQDSRVQESLSETLARVNLGDPGESKLRHWSKFPRGSGRVKNDTECPRKKRASAAVRQERGWHRLARGSGRTKRRHPPFWRIRRRRDKFF